MDINKENQHRKAWASQTLKEIRASYSAHVKGQSGAGLKSLNVRTGKSFGEINRISFGMTRYLVWIQKGAGKGMGGQKGSSWFYKEKRVKTNRKSLGKMNSANRKAKDIINPVLEYRVYNLAELVRDFKADEVVKAIKIK